MPLAFRQKAEEILGVTIGFEEPPAARALARIRKKEHH